MLCQIWDIDLNFVMVSTGHWLFIRDVFAQNRKTKLETSMHPVARHNFTIYLGIASNS